MARWVAEATATRIEPWRFGTAILTDDFPRRYDSNFVRVERPLDGAGALELGDDADRVLGHLQHREVIVEDDDVGARLVEGFRGLGYDADRHLTMVQRRDVGAVADALVVEIDAASLHPAVVATNLAIPTMSAADATMLADFRTVAATRAGTRFFAVELDGVIAAYCELYLHAGAAQVEDVNTLEPWRNRGAGRAVVLGAAAAALAAGADLVWLVADADDWPKRLYEKLGFESLATSWQFTKVLEPPPVSGPNAP
jgi:GNAT superfamily N-acetyltransferase